MYTREKRKIWQICSFFAGFRFASSVKAYIWEFLNHCEYSVDVCSVPEQRKIFNFIDVWISKNLNGFVGISI
ncbi:unnamed protein product [Acanthoscelides obtectus]|uniref:Uncharacterized protein n=1 Tax=Acanthoscelides obtectus TaxID=200917 RepID=A0A9P0LC89_ACAOB|nr:unnamed protein product [Acanthoscelides obtectus]CAK1631982.1 hypothetical protein AOBTE_LOCUS7276 [Acanthoscelides obtectus]